MEVTSPPAKRLAAPRWLNPRLGVGLLLVALSTLLGARVVAAADDSQLVWSARRDMPAGYQLTGADLAAVRVRLGASLSHYLSASGSAPAGYVLERPVVSGELVPGEALAPPGQARPQRRIVAIPVRPGHWPHDLDAGDLVDVYATPSENSARASPAASRLVVRGVPVQSTPHADGGVLGGGDAAAAVEVSVPLDQVSALVASVESSDMDIVWVGSTQGLVAARPASTATAPPGSAPPPGNAPPPGSASPQGSDPSPSHPSPTASPRVSPSGARSALPRSSSPAPPGRTP